MTINYYGHSCFKITNQGGRFTILTDPYDKKIGLTPPRGAADIVTVSSDHYDHNNVATVSGEPFIINNPGEYEVKGVSITGISTFCDEEKGAGRGINTVYLLKVDDINICHLGSLGQGILTDKEIEALGEVEILLVPVGGKETIGAKDAVKIVNQLEPKIVIPMNYKMKEMTINVAEVDEFLQEMGVEKKNLVDKLVLKKRDLADKTAETIIMKL